MTPVDTFSLPDAQAVARKSGYRGDRLRLFTQFIDVGTIAATGYLLGYLMQRHRNIEFTHLYQTITFFCTLYAFTLFKYFKLYEGWRGRSIAEMCTRVTGAWISVWLAGIFAAFLLHQSGGISRAWALSWLASTALLLAANRISIDLFLRTIRGRGLNTKTVFLVGYGSHGKSLHHKTQQSPVTGYSVIGCFMGADAVEGHNLRQVDALEQIRAFVVDNQIDEVWVTLSLRSCADLEQVVMQLRGLPVEIRWMPDASMANFITHRTGQICGELAIDLNHMPVPGVHGFLKEVFDRTTAVALTLLFSPALLAIALAVRVSSPGPVFYGHTRIGENGRRFKVYKFRSMVTDSQRILEELLASDPLARAEWDADHKLRNDPRVTRIGRLLRATSLDELPQLFNVIRGDMSLVGPRPIVDAEISKYGDAIRYYYAARPGMTGLWQVSGRNDVSYTSRVKLDSHYVLTWTLGQDVAILLRTVGVVFGKRGAY